MQRGAMRRAVFHLVLWPVLATLAATSHAATARHRRPAPAPTRAELRRDERAAERADPCAKLSRSRLRTCEQKAERAEQAEAEAERASRSRRRTGASGSTAKPNTAREIQPEDLVGGVEAPALAASPALRGSLRAEDAPPAESKRVGPHARRGAAAKAGKLREVILEDGQSLDDLAMATGVSVADLARLNGIATVEDVPTGMRLRLPSGAVAPAAARLAVAPVAARLAAAPPPPASVDTPSPSSRRSRRELDSAEPSFGPRPYASLGSQTVPLAAPPVRRGGRTEADALAAYAVASARAPHLADREDGRHDRFVWPVRAEVTSTFGAHGMGQRNDGVDFAARPGDAVRASAAGEVVYAGKEIATSGGNLVLLKHADGWVTAYSHLGRLTVAMRQTVEQGQEIAETVDAAGASVHFEVRQPGAAGAKPVDPVSVLPARAAGEPGRG